MTYETAPKVQRPPAALTAASNWCLEGPSGAMDWIRARRRARSSRGVQAGAILELVVGVGLWVDLVWNVWFVGGGWWVEENWEWNGRMDGQAGIVFV